MTNQTYTIISENPNSTVVAEYEPSGPGAQKYQSEAELEAEFIRILQDNGYEYLRIKNNGDLLKNLRAQLSRLNDVVFTDAEWDRLLTHYLVNRNDSIAEKTAKVQENHIYNLRRDDGTTKNIRILDKDNIHNNRIQVINQYEAEGAYKNRYDVTVLVNGLPMVHIELKRRGMPIREAFTQIKRYQRDSFWADSGLFEYMQLFVISNGTHTKYYSNTTRNAHLKESQSGASHQKTSHSFEFTSWWTDGKNKRIPDLVDFAKTFFSKHTLLSILTRYCVFTTERMLLVMRPYQIAAAESILNKITMSSNLKQTGDIGAGGYIWHTTGSGKTLTSFKTAQLASRLDFIDKVIFVVDRKDLDYQTMKEYDKFQKGAANSNTSTAALTKQLGKPDAKIIITTIQKLARFISTNKGHAIFDKHVVLIFDECHRSQFGEMHTKITKAFKKYHIFGFTGTPILAANAATGGKPNLKTTKQAFGQKLHAYTIVDAIDDNNVLPFRVGYVTTLKMKDDIKDKKVRAIDMEKAANAPERIKQVTDYILENFDDKTKRNKAYTIGDKRFFGFNSIFAVSSIEVAKKYYAEFKARETDLKVALIYSFGANDEADDDGILADEDFDTSGLDDSHREFLDKAIQDYNGYFKTNFDSSAGKFENYYRDLSQKVKNREVDLLIVVNMFLTGFDATTLNTLWVDKNLRHHGLLQAFSRTNRILNSVKTFGNIVCFRNLEQATNEALAIFGNKEAGGIVLLKPYNDYYYGWDKEGIPQKGYKQLIEELKERFPLPVYILGEQAEKDFVSLWGAILRLRNILTSFDEFRGNEILTEREFQDYQSAYLDLYDKLRRHNSADKENINDDLIFEIELVKQITINIDYILQLVAQYHKTGNKDKEVLVTIDKAMSASLELRSKKELIERFIATLNPHSVIETEWRIFADKSRAAELETIIESENLKPEKTREFMANVFRDGWLRTTGTTFAEILPAVSMFDADNTYVRTRAAVEEKLQAFFEKYFGI